MKQKITHKMQQVAADILSDIEIAMMDNKEIPDWIDELYDRVFNDYDLCRDPFTGMVCTSEEYFKNNIEYQRQTMDELYGHHDGLE